MTVFDEVIGQAPVVHTLQAATTAAAAMVAGRSVNPGEFTHAWLFIGPPGSGRSVAARAFAAALMCEMDGCGQCAACHTVRAGTHADVRTVEPAGLTIGVDEMRTLVLQASGAPTGGRWQVVLIADADRLTEAASNALLKAIEEPAPRTVFLLCSPSDHPDDIGITVRSRCRVVSLRTPPAADVAAMLQASGVDGARAAWAAAAAQAHVGRARRLATDPSARERRAAVLAIPRLLTNVGACFAAADALIAAAEAESAVVTTTLDDRENTALDQTFGVGAVGKGVAKATRGLAGARRDLAKRQRSRLTRTRRDAIDRALVDLAAFYRDILVTALLGSAATGMVVHTDMLEVTQAAAAKWSPESIVRRIDAVLACSTAIAENVKPRIAVEAMMLALHQG